MAIVATLPTAAQPDPLPSSRIIAVGDCLFGAPYFQSIVGPCSASSREQALAEATATVRAGGRLFRAGAFKPRSDPKSFQGFGELALEWLLEAKLKTGLLIVTEILDPRHLDAVLGVADLLQIGARGMQNMELLKEVGLVDRPVLIKRGLAATIDEVVNAAGYVLHGGNDRVILCERGIRTFETRYRFTLDLLAVPILQELTGLPVIVDPSHAAGRRDLVARASKAAVSVGADGLIVEFDTDPEHALSDGPQQMRTADLPAFLRAINRVARGEGRDVR